DKDPTICLWDVATGKKVATLQGRGEPLWFRSFSPDGTLLATTSQDPNKLAGTGEIKVWDVAARKERAKFKAPAPSMNCVAFSPNGKILASGHWGGLIVLLDAASGKEIRRWQAAGITSLINPAFSPDGKTLISTAMFESSLRLWDVATGKE